MLYRNRITGIQVDTKVPYTAEGWEPVVPSPAVVVLEEPVEPEEVEETEEEVEETEEPEKKPVKKTAKKK